MYDDTFDDEAMVAALDAAEKALNNSHDATASSVALSLPEPNIPVKQPIPQKLPKGASSILVSTRQKGNPLLTHIKNIPWEYASIPSDYSLGSTCALFLSLKYHRLHPEYIYTRIPKLPHTPLRILLVLVDVDTPSTTDPLRELTKTSLINNLTLILCWTAQEAGRYLEAYKSLEKTPPTNIMGRREEEFGARIVECVTKVRSVNKVDAVSLVANFGSLRGAMNARGEELGLMAGWGDRKVARWERAVEESFRAGRKSKNVPSLLSSSSTQRKTKKGRKAGAAIPDMFARARESAQHEIQTEDEDAFIAAAVAQFAEMEKREKEEEEKARQSKAQVQVPAEDEDMPDSIMEAIEKFRWQG